MAAYIKFLTRSVIFTLMGIAIGWLVFWATDGAKLYSVQSGSMAPILHRGDLVIDTKIDPVALKAGQIITYSSTQNPNEVVTHRIISISYYRKYLITKGDNLTTTDPPVKFDQITGKTFKVLPKAGYIFDEIHKPLGLIGFVYLPAFLISFSEIWFLAGKIRGSDAYQFI